ncbi:3-keto-disaccharide hydrolase [Flagellimonas sp.]|uniref:3-keto-disaccharide hydrolase n=1 Tax=Flagellimonas sp. TaxID=2058762 RepID=UPI003B514CF2
MKRLILFMALILAFACKDKPKEEPKQVADQEMEEHMDEKEDGWVTLFDGTSFNGWHLYNEGEIDEPWKLEDGTMVFYPPKDRQKGESYNIVTDKEFTNFVLSLEWKISERGNSGIFWGVYEGEQYGQPYLTGPEIQVLDDENHPDAKNGTTHQAGALYDMIAPSEKAVKPAGEWNSVELTVNHETNQGQVLLNGTKIVEFPVHGPEWDNMVSKSKFADWEGFGAYKTGKIGLQDHGDIVAYRNIKIKEL